TDAEAHHPVSEVDPDSVPYFSLIVVPGDSQHSDPTGRRPAPLPASGEPSPGRTAGSADSTDEQSPASRGVVHVAGLGPGPPDWLAPVVPRILSEVGHVVGYAPYVDRAPQRAGLRRHCSGNTVEVDRAARALELAGAGEQVAVVSGGD